MKINQLFNNIVTPDILNELLSCFGLDGIEDKRSFKKQDLVLLDTIHKLEFMKETLMRFYLPCKAKIYLENITDKKAITILRQILRTFNYKIISKEKNMQTKKVVFYFLEAERMHGTNINRDVGKVVTFD